MLNNIKDVEHQVNAWGFLPFFKGEIDGFSIEEQIAPEHWFDDEEGGYGVWDWKNDIILDADCAYGKFYRGKACFVSMEWFPDLMNWRRAHYEPTADEQLLLSTVREHGSLLSRELKKLCGYNAPPRPRASNPVARRAAQEQPRPKPERKGFDGAVTRLQMSCHLLTATFEYHYDRQGRPYGWSVGRYCTPEEYFGPERLRVPRTPDESRARLERHLAALLPQATEAQVRRLIG